MNSDNRRWKRHPVEVPCTVNYDDGLPNPTRASIVNMSTGGLMLASEQGFIANERVSITLDDDYDALLFEFAATTVRWSQAASNERHDVFHVGIALEADLPRRILLTEQ